MTAVGCFWLSVALVSLQPPLPDGSVSVCVLSVQGLWLARAPRRWMQQPCVLGGTLGPWASGQAVPAGLPRKTHQFIVPAGVGCSDLARDLSGLLPHCCILGFVCSRVAPVSHRESAQAAPLAARCGWASGLSWWGQASGVLLCSCFLGATSWVLGPGVLLGLLLWVTCP